MKEKDHLDLNGEGGLKIALLNKHRVLPVKGDSRVQVEVSRSTGGVRDRLFR